MVSKHLLRFSHISPQEKTEGGSRIKASKLNFPVLDGVSIYKLNLVRGGVREPHWHANADELGYCIKGQVLVSLYHTMDTKATFLVKEGEMFYIPSGALHYIENVSEVDAEMILYFTHQEPEDFGLSSAFGMFTDSVLANTWQQDASVFKHLKRSLKPSFATINSHPSSILDQYLYPSPYHFKIEDARPILFCEGGSAHMARHNFWPILKQQSLYSLRLTKTGMREPHWHPETSELGYVKKGRGRMSILNPQGNIDTYIMQEGDIYFIPKAYPHHIENLEDDILHLLIFFDQNMPKDVGFTGSVRSFPDGALASSIQTNLDFVKKLPKYFSDLFIVNKLNPQD